MIVVDGFHKSYAGMPAVQGVSFSVNAGDILGLVGPNGAGKTTILKSLIGMIPASRGTLSVAGYDVAEDALEVKRRLAYVPDDPVLFSDLTVDEHLSFIAAAYAVKTAEARAVRLLQQFELSDRRSCRAGDLSRGMRQKLAICCAYLRDPPAVLFDEPMTGLDPHGIRMLKDSICERAAGGSAVIISSHLLAVVEDICTHVMILTSGESRYWGPIRDLKSAFATGSDQSTLEQIFFLATQDRSDIDAAGHAGDLMPLCTAV